MANYDFDLFVIGGGSGGVRAGRWSGGLGAKVAICEEDRFGGTCVLRGCIPKKLMVMASEIGKSRELATQYGWTIEGMSFQWDIFKSKMHNELGRLSRLYEKMLENNHVHRINGQGKILDPHTVEANGRKFTAEKILIAVGGWPSTLAAPGGEILWSSNDVFKMENLPSSILVIGGGYIGVEFAGFFNSLGVKTEVMIRSAHVLRGFDSDMRSAIQEELIKKGIRIIANENANSFEKTTHNKIRVCFNNEDREYDAVLSAVGRRPKTDGIGLEAVGVALGERGEVKVNEKYQTSVPSIYAIGDCTNRVNLTPVATAEGTFLAESWFGQKDKSFSYENIPTAVFSQPPIATVGLTEEEAIAKQEPYDVYESRFRPLKLTITDIDERTYMKMIVNRETQRILGIHMMGADAPEIMQGFAVSLKSNSTKLDFDKTIGIHPTSAEEFVTMRTLRVEEDN